MFGLGKLTLPPTTYRQHDATDCGATCLRMVAKHHGRAVSRSRVRALCEVGRLGVSLHGLSKAAEVLGFRTVAARLPLSKLSEAPLPCIAFWRQEHFVVVFDCDERRVQVADPAHGMLSYSHEEFSKHWGVRTDTSMPSGIALLLEPTPALFTDDATDDEHPASALRQLYAYLRPYRKHLLQIAIGLVFASMVGLIFPFLTQAIVDIGIGFQDRNFVHLILAAQLTLYLGRSTVELIRGRLLLHIGARINISLLSDFLAKLMRLPVPFFETRQIGTFMQRIADHQRIERFLTASTLDVLFSTTYLLIFGGILALYDLRLVAVFFGGAALAGGFIAVTAKRRRDLDFRRFNELARTQGTMIQLLTGIAEIKLTGAEIRKRWEWEQIQARLFRINLASLSVEQYQEFGVGFLTEAKDIVITVMTAHAVIEGRMTIGMMLAVQYMVGQMNMPLRQIIGFSRTAQDARMALERLAEIHEAEDEEPATRDALPALPARNDISLRGLCFAYPGQHNSQVLSDLDLEIPEGKVTAIVGASGSGKTTLLKLLLKFYEPTSGDVASGGVSLRHLSSRDWRRRCGAVLQDGYLFSDTIARNVALVDEDIDPERLLEALELAAIREFVEQLPLGWNTQVGPDGQNLSQGQRQRLLIARAIYHRPEFLFFDEATSALDATNERRIMENLESVFQGRTVVVIAHRLSTVQAADQIAVLDHGRIVERGDHESLCAARGPYFQLVRNQLELGS